MLVKRIYLLQPIDIEMIENRLKELDQSYSWLARELKVSRELVRQWTNMVRTIQYEKIIKIQELLEIKLTIEGEY